MSEGHAHKPEQAKLGEPGTVAVTVEGRGEAAPTYRADLAGTPPRLRIRDLCITYVDRTGHNTEAVSDVSFDIVDKPGTGEIVVFLGPSGCGKSTILKAVAGLLAPTKGEILVNGKPFDGPGRDRGMVFQAYTSFGWLTDLVWDSIRTVYSGRQLDRIRKTRFSPTISPSIRIGAERVFLNLRSMSL